MQRRVCDGVGESDAVVAEVEDGVVLAHEDVAQDPERVANDCDAHEARDALRHAALGLLKGEQSAVAWGQVLYCTNLRPD